MSTRISALGRFLPAQADAAGVRRPIATEPVGPSHLAERATRDALTAAGLEVDAIEFIIFATATPDVTFPGAGCFLQSHLDCGTVGALDVRGQCTGFLFALEIADQFVSTGTYQRILVAGGEVHSSSLDYSGAGADLARRFADGAGVALVEEGDGDGLLAVRVHTDGRTYDKFWCEHPASRQVPTRFTEENFAAGGHLPAMDVAMVSEFGRKALAEAVGEVLAEAGQSIGDVDLVVAAHIDPETADGALQDLGVESSRRSVPSASHGHIMGASLPIALSEAKDAGTVGDGSLICLAAAGAGFTWGAALVRL